MPGDEENGGSTDEKVKAEGGTLRVVQRTILNIISEGGGPSVGTEVGGSGVVTDVSGSGFTVEFAGGAPTGPIEIPPGPTIVVYEFRNPANDSHASFFSLPAVGDFVEGGGVVIDVGGSSVTIAFPNGLPDGPINLPGVETIVVEETPTQPPDVVPTSAIDTGFPDDEAATSPPTHGIPENTGPFFEPSATRWRLPCPGVHKWVPLIRQGVTLMQISNAKSTGTCPCTIFIASFNARGPEGHAIEDETTAAHLDPGETLAEFRAKPGAVEIRASCAGNCNRTDCFAELTIPGGSIV
jgi:hypothetical protein